MRLTVGMLRQIIKEEVTKVRRARLREANYEPSMIGNVDDVGNLSFPSDDDSVLAAEETLKGIFDAEGSSFSNMWAEMWNVLCDEMTGMGGNVDLRGIGHAAGFPSDSFDWMQDAKVLVNAIYTVPEAQRGNLRDGHEIHDEWARGQ